MTRPITILRKKSKAGDNGLPRATLAFYGPHDKLATKAVLGIFLTDNDDDAIIHRYINENKDARYAIPTQEAILARLREHEVKSLVMVERVFGCPHEEGIDYPEGESCPSCPFWKDRDRFKALD